ncbi:hypothetical protein [Photobacterium swingsii]|uniref:hypothetical protein n=1 Tax=Photobacterium swingsii TaxID=680026 RepID=UPI000B21AF31
MNNDKQQASRHQEEKEPQQAQQSKEKDPSSKTDNAQANAKAEKESQGAKSNGKIAGEKDPTDKNNALSASNPILKKLEQIPDDTGGLIRAQIILQLARKRHLKQQRTHGK